MWQLCDDEVWFSRLSGFCCPFPFCHNILFLSSTYSYLTERNIKMLFAEIINKEIHLTIMASVRNIQQIMIRILTRMQRPWAWCSPSRSSPPPQKKKTSPNSSLVEFSTFLIMELSVQELWSESMEEIQ
jgi:hypothetical protein